MDFEHTLESRQRLYDAIKDCKDKYSRHLLYIKFVQKYYPEAFSVIISGKLSEVTKGDSSHR